MGLDILIVEDNRINRSVFVSLVRGLGATTRTAKNGIEAVELIGEAMPSIILMDLHMPLMDLHMPLMDGYSALERLFNIYGDTLPPAVATSANATLEEGQRCKSADFTDFLPKPVDPEKLRDVLTCAAAPARLHKGLDVAQGLFLANGSHELYTQNINRFRGNFEQWQDALRKLQSTANAKDMSDLLHVIKGVAGTVAARNLADIARKAETNPDALAMLDDEITFLKQEIPKELEHPPLAASKANGTRADLLHLVTRHDMAAIDMARRLSSHEVNLMTPEAHKKLMDALDRMDFTEAEHLLGARTRAQADWN